MIQNIEKYLDALFSAHASVSSLEEALNTVKSNAELKEIFNDPNVTLEEKKNVSKDLFAPSVNDFVAELAASGKIDSLGEIVEAYISQLNKQNNVAEATITCVTEPDDEQLKGIKEFVCKQENANDAVIKVVKDDSLIGGFIVTLGDKQFDFSIKKKLDGIKQKVMDSARNGAVTSENVLAVLKKDINDFELRTNSEEIGTVIRVGDGIATIHGLDHAMYGEIVVFENGVKGMVQDIKRHQIGVILFDSDTGVEQGTKVKRTHKKAGVPVGDGFIGRIVNSLGEPIDGKGEIKADGYRPVEQPAPSIVDRQSVDTPLATGILSIDSMFPIGRGQRELIIGDRQTGKTSIAMDTILNQKGKDVVCIYVAIGQKASTIAKLVNTLKKNDAMSYTIIVSATASDPAPLQYIAPYSGTALAEYFMYQGKDVLIVYDDLSKHAVAYRAISLLLERSPGREAYPGDVFYLHSRLLERSSRLTPEAGGGSITALPIIETQAGDESAYIPTNVISITDGQIFLESELFFAGQRPAVNVGLSVSRVGGAAQTKAMKKAAGSIRIDLAQYREMEVFTQFSSDLDESTKKQLAHGKALMELLKQPLGHPMSMAEQVITLVAANAHVFSDLEAAQVKPFQKEMLADFNMNHTDIINQLETTKSLSDDIKDSIVKAAESFKAVKMPKSVESETMTE